MVIYHGWSFRFFRLLSKGYENVAHSYAFLTVMGRVTSINYYSLRVQNLLCGD